jgi:hypothetical protein
MAENQDILDSKEEKFNDNQAPLGGNEFVTLKKYKSNNHAEEIQKLLISKDIEAKIDSNVPLVDVTFVSNTHNDQFEVQVKSIDFKKAQIILEEENVKLLEGIGKEHYLYQFSDKELYDILLRPDQWGDLDSALAVKLLKERGKPVDVDLLESLKSQRVEDLSKPEEGQTPWVIIGYLSAFFGGILGVIIGYSLWKATKTLPNGSKVFSYSEKSQNHGRNIFILGVVMVVVWVLLRVLVWSN